MGKQLHFVGFTIRPVIETVDLDASLRGEPHVWPLNLGEQGPMNAAQVVEWLTETWPPALASLLEQIPRQWEQEEIAAANAARDAAKADRAAKRRRAKGVTTVEASEVTPSDLAAIKAGELTVTPSAKVTSIKRPAVMRKGSTRKVAARKKA